MGNYYRKGFELDVGKGVGFRGSIKYPGLVGGIVRDPMFVVCCVINNKTFEVI